MLKNKHTKELVEFAVLIISIYVLLFILYLEFLGNPLYAQSTQATKSADNEWVKFLIQVCALAGSIIVFAFYNGAKLGKIEQKIESIKEAMVKQASDCSDCKREAKEARKEMQQEINSTKEQLLKIELRSFAHNFSEKKVPQA